ncbi:hypothetical protein SODALDRAFT_361569 [Sodiomyces alkalinus F11]|uniref:Cell wall proline rich protein n=1 Tax=Sodiomyces alkalinus (strain CBS 110278 / VKM F-3762 / F11) TaxID=1314773 RepID=A0A3N2PQG6_SODAK|nr:hypothetical protein SODALDRAFT_361569 [Sodiomyces alkalinus F11]ROT36753.1 hypothetical protein SODALDRAFT_361569 [Sodiomyces alkalinus F11]
MNGHTYELIPHTINCFKATVGIRTEGEHSRHHIVLEDSAMQYPPRPMDGVSPQFDMGHPHKLFLGVPDFPTEATYVDFGVRQNRQILCFRTESRSTTQTHDGGSFFSLFRVCSLENEIALCIRSSLSALYRGFSPGLHNISSSFASPTRRSSTPVPPSGWMKMATIGPERVMDTTGMSSFEGPSSGRHVPSVLSMDAGTHPNHLDMSSNAPQPSPRTVPPPNPPFVFPAREPSVPTQAPARSTARRPRSVVEMSGLSTATKVDKVDTEEGSSVPVPVPTRPAGRPSLPSFNFNPGASLPPDSTPAFLSPPLSPRSPRHGPSASLTGGHGHRRGGSEFVGGNVRTGESITVMSTSPTKSESGFASPAFQPPSVGAPSPSPGGRRRGHNHRRSAAISSHDLTLILQPPQRPGSFRGSSAPASPAGFGHKFEDPRTSASEQFSMPRTPDLEQEKPDDNKQPTSEESEDSADIQTTPRVRPAPRARVGFSDELEFIPRPLSLVSSDGSSTATARPGGHSVSGSLSSIISELDMTIPENPSAEAVPLERTPTRQTVGSRPSTAGAVLERSQSIQSVSHSGPSLHRRNSIPSLTSLPDPTAKIPSNPSPTKTPKRWSFFGLDPFAASLAPVGGKQSPRAASYDLSPKLGDSASVSSDPTCDSAAEPGHEPADVEPSTQQASGKGAIKKKKKNKKKVKSWAGSILKSKSKPRGKKPPSASMTHHDVTPNDEVPSPDCAASEAPAEAEAVALSVVAPVVTVTVTDSSDSTDDGQRRRPRRMGFDDDSSFPMIDLDAALGPFNTPLPHNPEWEAAQKAAGPTTKRQLHSAQGMRGFSGPGMHYHRRAESAPEMVPFEAARFGISRFGSSSTMADVFEEDEEGEDQTDMTDTGSDEDETPPATKAAKPKAFDLDGSTLQEAGTVERRRPTASMKSERSAASLHEQVIVEEASTAIPPVPVPVPAPGQFEKQTRSDSTSSAAPSPRRIMAGGDTTTMATDDVSPLQLPTCNNVPVSPYAMSHASSFPSPRSPISYDAQRISTAPSSVNNDENTLQSLLLGEPGPEVRLSMDVPPSLTSSRSTMTRHSSTTWIPGPQPRAQLPFRPDQRPSSVSSVAFGRRRSSLASLSRLISSSHGERSKLSTEVQYESDAEKKQKASKAKRLSRLMQFWKPKPESRDSTKTERGSPVTGVLERLGEPSSLGSVWADDRYLYLYGAFANCSSSHSNWITANSNPFAIQQSGSHSPTPRSTSPPLRADSPDSETTKSDSTNERPDQY